MNQDCHKIEDTLERKRKFNTLEAKKFCFVEDPENSN